MLFKLTVLRNGGKRLLNPEPVHDDASLHTSNNKGFTCLTVNSYFGGASHKVKPLFEPKILAFELHLIHLMGFELDSTGCSHVQEWVLEQPKDLNKPASSTAYGMPPGSAPRNPTIGRLT